MRISLIGMSGCGKSYWTKKLAGSGFRAFYCDDMIEDGLAPELMKPDGGRMEVGEWMRFPFDPGYQSRESRYLSLEKAVLDEFLCRIGNPVDRSLDELVIDTTGSVVYVGDKILEKLRKTTTVVHLETPPDIREQMLNLYMANRRPVLWRGYFNKAPHETNDAALVRCYADLIDDREKLYEKWSDVTVGYPVHSRNELSPEEFLEAINR